jgi:hypothetical protein
MRLVLALRHLAVHPGRAAVLLAGYAVGVAVMIVLLSVGDAMLRQSRDPALVGGGDLLAIPEGLDLEALRTGGLGGMFHGIDHARFVSRQLVGGPRFRGVVRTVSPVLEQQLLTLAHGGRTWPVRAGGELPDAAARLGAGLDVTAGAWRDGPSDRAWLEPSPTALYDALDRAHIPSNPDSTWAEWQYYNIVVSPDEWWYITLLVGGEVPDGRWGGQVLITRRAPTGSHRRAAARATSDEVRFDTLRADLVIGGSSVQQVDGRYRLRASAERLSVDLEVTPAPNRYFPPVELRGAVRSGYAVPALRAEATGRVCVDGRCRDIERVAAYHDHNWGVWRDVTWDWGIARGGAFDLLYGGVRSGAAAGASPSHFLTLVDSLGVRQVFRFGEPTLRWGPDGPEALTIVATQGGDTLRLEAAITARSVSPGPAARGRFWQLRGRWELSGRATGAPVEDRGEGFFETWSER